MKEKDVRKVKQSSGTENETNRNTILLQKIYSCTTGSTDYKSIHSTIKYYVPTGKYRFRGNVTWFADVSLAVLNGLMYFLRWNKPLDVRCPVSVYLRVPDVPNDSESNESHDHPSEFY